MGRAPQHASVDYAGKIRIERVPMVDGDYDPGGAYWGGGLRTLPLFVIWSVGVDADGEGIEYFERGESREDVKRSVRARYPKARFYR